MRYNVLSQLGQCSTAGQPHLCSALCALPVHPHIARLDEVSHLGVHGTVHVPQRYVSAPTPSINRHCMHGSTISNLFTCSTATGSRNTAQPVGVTPCHKRHTNLKCHKSHTKCHRCHTLERDILKPALASASSRKLASTLLNSSVRGGGTLRDASGTDDVFTGTVRT